jgi:hypothetical protein
LRQLAASPAAPAADSFPFLSWNLQQSAAMSAVNAGIARRRAVIEIVAGKGRAPFSSIRMSRPALMSAITSSS